MKALPTLGGTNGFATGTNNQGQTVGWAENTVHDPTCVAPQVLQFRAVFWGPKEGQIQQLPPLPGDTVSAATALNDRGQVVGISGICDRAVGRFSAINAVLWEDGQPIDIGNLGGAAWNTPMSINERGDTVGFANTAAGGGFSAHAFLWTSEDGIRELGTLPGDSTSQALGINERREIVGTSCDAAFNCRAFLWRDGAMTDLNDLTNPDYPDKLVTANDINEAGRITGQAAEQKTGALVAFRAQR
jgi:probable HAF family extracellular repeat protein